MEKDDSAPPFFEVVVTLPIPRVPLRPNGQHGHWRTAYGAKKAAKSAAKIETLKVLNGRRAPLAHGYHLECFFAKAAWDDDNAHASCKAYLDGIAEAMGVDDKLFRFKAINKSGYQKNPRIEIHMVKL
jgi:crossover junction endodeoxyribonuclease RusA